MKMVMVLLRIRTGRDGEFNVGVFEKSEVQGASPGEKWQGVPRRLLSAVALVVVVVQKAREDDRHNSGDAVSDLVGEVIPAEFEH